jgi:excisionase family DNA binding protein
MLDTLSRLGYTVCVSSKTYTTREAAEAVGITRATLQAWIAAGKLKAPRVQKLGKAVARLWTSADVSRLRSRKAEIYGKKPE